MSVVVDPDEFYERNKEDLSVRYVLGIVALAGLASSLLGVVILYYQLQITAGPATPLLVTGGVITALANILSVFAFWFVYAVLIHVVAMVVTEGSALSVPQGTFRQLCLFVGCGFIAGIMAGLNKAVATFLTVRNLFAASDLSELNANVLASSLQGATAMRMTVAVTAVIVLWRGFIWVFAVKHTYDVDLRTATVIAAVPSVCSILLTVFVFNARLLGL